MDQKKEFTGVWIPKHVIEDEDLSMTDKIIYAEIACFVECYKTNKALGERYGLKANTISIVIKKLIERGYVEVVHFDGRIRTLVALKDKSNQRQTLKKIKGRYLKKSKADIEKNQTIDNIEKTKEHTQAEKNFDSNLVSASARFLGTEKLQGTQSKKEVLEPLIEKLNLKRGDEYEPDNLSPLDRKLIKRQTEKILGLRRATKWQKDIYGIGSDYLAAYNNTTKADYIGTVILDDVAKNIATYLELGETRQTLRDMMIAFFNSEKAKDITITPRTVFSTHTYNSWKQSKL